MAKRKSKKPKKRVKRRRGAAFLGAKLTGSPLGWLLPF